MEIMFLALIFASLKTTCRIYDFENTINKMQATDWNNLRISYLIGSEISFLMHIIFYQQIKFSKIWFLIHLALNNYSFYHLDGKFNNHFIFYSLLFTIFFLMIGQKLNIMIEKMAQSLSENSKFKTIFDSLDESIYIIHQDTEKIEYVNNKFFLQF